MAGTLIDLATWDRAETFRFFRGFQRPHFAITARVDVTALMTARRRDGTSLFRACLWALGAGLNAAPELRTRFRGDTVTLYDRIDVSPVVSMPDDSFRFAYIPWDPDWRAFDREAEARIAEVREGSGLNPDESATDAVAYLSAVPWMDFTALTNAMPRPEDNIPRATWGKIVPKGAGHDMAVGIELHHAIADGRHAGAFFEAAQRAFDGF
ncbi:MAG: CatA-like O-acetyltransferase [Paracoccaceae bacterium]|nr:CatA-like O-acetyltransferase [Paracoccaceae bacterium]